MSEIRVDNILSADGSTAPTYSQGVNVAAGKTFTNAGDFTTSGITSFSGAVTFGTGAVVSGLTTFTSGVSGLNVVGPATFTQGATVTGIVTFDQQNVVKSTVGSGGITVGGASTLSGLLDVNNAADISGNLVTGGNLTVAGNISCAGTVTYEDVTNVDSVGLITARKGIISSGVVTATTFKGAVEATSLFSSGHADFNADLDVDGHTNLDNVSIAGVTTIADNSKLALGTGEDLSLYHTSASNDGFIKYQNENGHLRILSGVNGNGGIKINNRTDNAAYIHCDSEGAVSSYFNNSKKIETTNTGVLISGIATATQLSVGPGVLREKFHNDTGGGIQSNYTHAILTYGMVWYGSTNAAGSWTFDVQGNGSTTLNSLMAIGETTTMTMYSANNNASNYMTAFKVDGSTITVKWAGGTAPSAATGSGTDVYSMTIMKTANATFTVFGNFTNFA